MKQIIIIILLFSLSVVVKGQINNDINIDSLFYSHFSSLHNNINSNEPRLIPQTDIKFIYLVSSLSNIHIDIHSYSGHPLMTKAKINEIEKWYENNKHKITTDKISKGLTLLNQFSKEEILEEPKKLKIEDIHE